MKSLRWIGARRVLAVVCIGIAAMLARPAVSMEANDPPVTVAGRTLAAWVAELDSANAVARRRAVLSLSVFGPSAVPALTQALSHEDAAVRYWAASELGDLGDPAAPAIQSLRELHREKSIALRMPAAYALCRVGHIQESLPTLLEGLRHSERGVWNSAGDFLARVGPPARAAIPEIETEAKRGADHIADICDEALRRIRGVDQPLPSKTIAPTQGDAAGLNPIKKVTALAAFSKAFFAEGVGRFSHSAKQGQQPNVLWISAEDISPSLGCYGDLYAVTPRLDQLADEGLRFTRCFTHAGVCAISRSGLITGMYPVAIGSQHMRSNIVPPPYVKCFPEYLRAAGYWCTNRSKTDYNFASPPSAWDENSGTSRDWRGRAAGQPFFSVINLVTTHESQIRGKFTETQHDPAKAQLPPYIPDTPVTRRDWARYADLLTTLDRQVAAILNQLEEDGLADNTIVFFWGDHGQGLSRGKRWLYDSGTHTPLIIRWPGKLAPGSSSDDLVCFLDFAPTVLRLAGIELPKHFQGRVLPPIDAVLSTQYSVLNSQPTESTKSSKTRIGNKSSNDSSVVVRQPLDKKREFVFGHRDRMDETYDLIRSARDERFKYIRNFAPRRTYAQNIAYMNQMPTMKELRRLNAEGTLTGPPALFFRETKPVEELFDTAADPHEVVNLADRPEHADTLRRLRTVLERWQEEINDSGLIPEPLLAEQMRPDFMIATTAGPEFGREQSTCSLSCSTDGASIVFTTDTSDSPHWRLYVSPFEVATGTMLRAKACRLGFHDSREVRFDAGSK
jgi:N-sulfoglucosamine sulfohydrolase